MSVRLPDVIGALFLSAKGQLGFRCECGYVASGRTAMAVDAALRDHQRYRHLQSDTELAHAGEVDSEIL